MCTVQDLYKVEVLVFKVIGYLRFFIDEYGLELIIAENFIRMIIKVTHKIIGVHRQ